MALALNHNPATIMHVDLNSCFATIEQQANPLLRGKPIVVAAYDSPRGCVLAPSIEAKKYGIKTGMTVGDAKLLYPGVIVLTPDPPKYRFVHLKFRNIFKDYSPDVTPKSIDEAVIDLTHTLELFKGTVTDIGKEIKKRFREEIGEWMQCSIGVSTNRFLAKLAASLHKPDGLDIIDHRNVLDVYKRVSLLDLNGINTRFQARLNAAGIFTPMEFYQAPMEKLKRQVFQSILGYYDTVAGLLSHVEPLRA
jgi:DNA polymerase IV